MFEYIIKSSNGGVGGCNENYDAAFKEALSLLKTLFPHATISQNLNDLVQSPDYLVYENGKEKIFLEVKPKNKGE